MNRQQERSANGIPWQTPDVREEGKSGFQIKKNKPQQQRWRNHMDRNMTGLSI
jgi:hypothetical protein